MRKFKSDIISLSLLSVLVLALAIFLSGCGFLNQSPTARISTTPSAEEGTVTVQVGEEITFDGGDSEPNGGEITDYEWEFKSDEEDSETDTGDTVKYTYEAEGTFTVKLTVTDDSGANGTAEVTIKVEGLEPPPPPE